MKKTQKKGVFFVFMCIVAFICACLYMIDDRGVYINDVHIKLHELPDYKNIISKKVDPQVLTSFNDNFKGSFRATVEDHQFGLSDIIDNSITLSQSYEVDADEFSQDIKDWNEKATPSASAYINVSTETIVPEVYGNQISEEAMLAHLDGSTDIDISEFYIKPGVTAEDLKASIEILNKYRNWKISYADSDMVITCPKDAVTIDCYGNVMLKDTSFIDDVMDDIDKEFTTLGKDIKFKTHSGEVITAKGGTFGNVVDVEKEKEELIKALKDKRSETNRKPVYSTDMGKIDKDYIEVSIDEQHVWQWVDGKVKSESDCVTGCVSKGRNTPTGVYYFDIIQNGKMLYPKGEKTGTWVNKWMRFTPDGCGLHDATWRSAFGGQIYKTNGSHGCVNLPKSYAYQIFEDVYIGLPVVVY